MRVEDARRVAKAVPGLVPVVRGARRLMDGFQSLFYRIRSRDRIFRWIYEENIWRGAESVSGTGSSARQTERLREELPQLWQRYGVRRLVDAPCGDFHWMRTIVSNLEQYVGVDIVEPLIDRNIRQYRTDLVDFRRADIVHDPLPKADMILCRDCLVHLSNRDAWLAIENMKRSGATYLLTTTFTARTKNLDIATGRWRPINLTRAPFAFPEPIEVLAEGCNEGGGKYIDKSLGLWRLDALPGSARRQWSVGA